MPGRLAIVVALTIPLFVVGFWGSSVDAPARGGIDGFTRWLASIGLGAIDYAVVEFTANVAWFTPFATVAVIVLGRRSAPWVVLGAVACSSLIETGQALFIPGRVATVWDVVANSLGALAGVALGGWIARRRFASAVRRLGTPGAVENIEDPS